jgi:hypothetical protein
MSNQTDLADDLLIGAAAIALEIFGNDDRTNQRRVHHLRHRLPVFQLTEDGMLYAFRSRLRAHLEAKSLEREQEIAAAAIVKPMGKTLRRRVPPGRRATARLSPEGAA